MVPLNTVTAHHAHSGQIDHFIGVSNAVRENGVIRLGISPTKSSVIPNAIDPFMFKADPSKINPVGTINIVYMARITQRKGSDLLMEIIPKICNRYPRAYFIIGGNGPDFTNLQFLVDKLNLKNQVELLGMVNHKDVPGVLNRGHIFLNTSITEAFCISALEAACAGLLVVSTNVGGTPEILPPDMMYLADPDTESLQSSLEKAIKNYENITPSENHERIMSFYSWRDIAQRVEKTYYDVLQEPSMSWWERLSSSFQYSKDPIITQSCILLREFVWYYLDCFPHLYY